MSPLFEASQCFLAFSVISAIESCLPSNSTKLASLVFLAVFEAVSFTLEAVSLTFVAVSLTFSFTYLATFDSFAVSFTYATRALALFGAAVFLVVSFAITNVPLFNNK